MLRKVIAASVVLVLSVGVVFADEFRAVITKVEGSKVSFFKIEGKGKEAKKSGDEMTLPVAKDAKIVVRGKKGEDPTPLEDGLKNKRFTKIGEKGVGAQIVTEGDKITEIRIFGRGGKKKQ